MSEPKKGIFGDGTKEGTDLSNDVFKTIFCFYKFLTPQMSELERFSQFEDWQELDSRTVKKYAEKAEGGKKKRLRLISNTEYLLDSLYFFESKRLWKYLEGICVLCEWQGEKRCKGKTPANGCMYCERCKHKSTCEQIKNTDRHIPEDCKILRSEFSRVDSAVALPYFYFPIKYILPLKESKVWDDNEVLEIFDNIIKSMKKFLGDSFNLYYVSSIIRHAYMYNLLDHIPADQKGAEPTENPITWLFAYSRRSLSISRAYNEETLKTVLEQITTDSIDGVRFELWKKCNDFEKDLLKSQERSKLGSVDDLLECSKEDVSIADIVIFLSHFADITSLQLRPIDIKILQKCLCWKDYSFEKFFEMLPQLPEHIEERFSKN